MSAIYLRNQERLERSTLFVVFEHAHAAHTTARQLVVSGALVVAPAASLVGRRGATAVTVCEIEPC